MKKLKNTPTAVYQRAWRANNKEKVKEYNRRARDKRKGKPMSENERKAHNEWERIYMNEKYASDAEFREKKKAQSRAYYYNNMEKCRAYQAEYRKLKRELKDD